MQLYFKDRRSWRAWLKANHGKMQKLWLVFFKKQTAAPGIPYEDAVEEASAVPAPERAGIICLTDYDVCRLVTA